MDPVSFGMAVSCLHDTIISRILKKHAWMYHLDAHKCSSHFGDFDIIFKVSQSVGTSFLLYLKQQNFSCVMYYSSPSPYPLSEDGNVLLCNVGKVKLLAEKNYMVDIKQITKIAVAIENNILVFEIETSTTQQGYE